MEIPSYQPIRSDQFYPVRYSTYRGQKILRLYDLATQFLKEQDIHTIKDFHTACFKNTFNDYRVLNKVIKPIELCSGTGFDCLRRKILVFNDAIRLVESLDKTQHERIMRGIIDNQPIKSLIEGPIAANLLDEDGREILLHIFYKMNE